MALIQYKRPRATLTPDDDVRSALSMNSGPMPSLRSYTSKGAPGTDMITRHVRTQPAKRKRAKVPNVLMKLFAPPFSLSRYGYGNAFTWAAGVYGTEPGGNNSNYRWSPGYQKWLSFIHLPLGDARFAADFAPSTTYTINDLIYQSIKYRATTNLPALTTSTFDTSFPVVSNVWVPPFKQATAPAFANWMNIAYDGGYCEHTFTNASNATCTMTVWECIPRVALNAETDVYNNTSYSCAPSILAANSKVEAAAKRPDATVDLGFTGTPADYNSGDDQFFGLSPKDDRLHMHWKVSKPRTIVLAPGQIAKIKVDFEPFSLTGKDVILNLGQSGTAAGGQVVPTFLPMCTKLLEIRCKSEIAHDASAAGKFTVVSDTLGTLLHTQKEYHKCRALPYVSIDNHVMVNDIIHGDAAATATQFINDETDEPTVIDLEV